MDISFHGDASGEMAYPICSTYSPILLSFFEQSENFFWCPNDLFLEGSDYHVALYTWMRNSYSGYAGQALTSITWSTGFSLSLKTPFVG